MSRVFFAAMFKQLGDSLDQAMDMACKDPAYWPDVQAIITIREMVGRHMVAHRIPFLDGEKRMTMTWWEAQKERCLTGLHVDLLRAEKTRDDIEASTGDDGPTEGQVAAHLAAQETVDRLTKEIAEVEAWTYRDAVKDAAFDRAKDRKD